MTQGGSGKRRNINSAEKVALIGFAGLVLASLITAAATVTSHDAGTGSNPGPSPTKVSNTASPATTAQIPATGLFTYPRHGASDIPAKSTFPFAGTVNHLEQGHHLLIFLEYNTQYRYWAGDRDVVVNHSHWTGTICIGSAGDINLFLVDVSPQGFAALANPNNDWSDGIPFSPIKIAPGVTILNKVHVRAIAAGTACLTKTPILYGR